MSYPRARQIVRQMSGFSAVKLLLATGRQTRPWMRPSVEFALERWADDGKLFFNYECFGQRRVAFLRMEHLDSDLQSALELAAGDCYRLNTLSEPDLIIDGGANTGLFSLAATARWPGVPIEAFEPVPDNVAVVKSHLALNGLDGQVHVHAAALSGRDGAVDFFVRAANQGSFDPTLPWTSLIKVPQFSLRTFLEGRTFNRVLIKLDIEGAEVDVLGDLFAAGYSKDIVIVMELHDISRNRPFVESLAARHKLDLEFFELGTYTGHCQLSSRNAR